VAPGDPKDGALDEVLLPLETGAAPPARRLVAGIVIEALLSDCRDASDGQAAGAPEDLDDALRDPREVVGLRRGGAAESAAFPGWYDEDDSDSDTVVDSFSSS
jgi:hypothetical protein